MLFRMKNGLKITLIFSNVSRNYEKVESSIDRWLSICVDEVVNSDRKGLVL